MTKQIYTRPKTSIELTVAGDTVALDNVTPGRKIRLDVNVSLRAPKNSTRVTTSATSVTCAMATRNGANRELHGAVEAELPV